MISGKMRVWQILKKSRAKEKVNRHVLNSLTAACFTGSAHDDARLHYGTGECHRECRNDIQSRLSVVSSALDNRFDRSSLLQQQQHEGLTKDVDNSAVSTPQPDQASTAGAPAPLSADEEKVSGIAAIISLWHAMELGSRLMGAQSPRNNVADAGSW